MGVVLHRFGVVFLNLSKDFNNRNCCLIHGLNGMTTVTNVFSNAALIGLSSVFQKLPVLLIFRLEGRVFQLLMEAFEGIN